ncbi:MAG: helix-turn-helix transcriptional regulator [Ferruginibacter sp.]|nr:helix-turn-helix transcriptional regulator [Bacteroidota bacterium]MBX2920179.1 helix-turn-helix transcriptional regulator [Ferruginibacter sp.]
MEFKIIAPGGNEIEIVPELPVQLKKETLPFTETIIGKAEFGKMVFRNYKGDGFCIWYSNYLIKHDTEIKGRADMMVLELHIQFQNQFVIDWDQVGKNDLRPFQFNLTYTPFVNNWAKFMAGRDCHTFDIHFTKEYLQQLAPSFPLLSKFLDQVEKGQPGNLSEIDHFLSPDMIILVNQLLSCSFKKDVAKFYIEAKVMELLILAMDHISGNHILAPIKLSAYDIERLYEAKKILLSDFENKISLLQLARKVGINDFKLKKGFKHLFGSTVFDFQQSAKMEIAMRELKETNKPVEEIAYSIGYDFVSNFNVAFKKHFGFSPGYLRRK